MPASWQYAYYGYEGIGGGSIYEVQFSHREPSRWNALEEVRAKKLNVTPFVYALRLLGDEGWECVGYSVGPNGGPTAVFKRMLGQEFNELSSPFGRGLG